IDSGHFGGEDDGGVDGMYFFINRILVDEDTEIPEPALSAELVIVQAKHAKSFSETAIDKVHTFARDLLDFDKAPESLTYLNSLAKDCIARFRGAYLQILGSPHTMKVSVHYAIDGEAKPDPKVLTRAENLKKHVRSVLSSADVSVEFWECKRLLKAARSTPTQQFKLETTQHFSTQDAKASVCLVGLKALATFLTDDNGAERRSMLEPNVRGYQGVNNRVNKSIRETLESTDTREFWWLNNGITILATDHHFAGPNLVVTRPQIVNGLQTSKEIFAYMKDKDASDKRNVLVRVVVPPDEITRNKIIRATNFQTQVSEASLHATDPLHLDIEEILKLHGLYYDRRKGEQREARRPISRIVSIPTLAKAVIAILLQRPNDARARPGNLLKDDATYGEIFNDGYSRDVYVACIQIDRKVQEYVKGLGQPLDVRRNLQYYAVMATACLLAKKAGPGVSEVAALLPVIQTGIGEGLLEEGWTMAYSIYRDLGATDKVSKGTELAERLRGRLKEKFDNANLDLGFLTPSQTGSAGRK
ncbi:MAG TPA: AIPR family protein, partial [Nitrospiraceae bacterium]